MLELLLQKASLLHAQADKSPLQLLGYILHGENLSAV